MTPRRAKESRILRLISKVPEGSWGHLPFTPSSLALDDPRKEYQASPSFLNGPLFWPGRGANCPLLHSPAQGTLPSSLQCSAPGSGVDLLSLARKAAWAPLQNRTLSLPAASSQGCPHPHPHSVEGLQWV